MYEINKSAIEKKIATARFAADEESNRSINNSLLALVEELCDYTNKVGRDLVDGAREREDSPQINDVFAALLPVEAEADYQTAGGLFRMDAVSEFLNCRFDESEDSGVELAQTPIPEKTVFHYERVFLDCEYDEIRNLDGDLSSKKKTYQGRYVDKKSGKTGPFEYSLEFDDSFVKAQEILFDYAEYYRVKNPVVLSPYSRKSFFIKYVEELCSDDIKLDFCFADNKIPVIEGKNRLYWNIKQSVENGKTYDAKEPYGDATKFVFRFEKTKRGGRLLPLPLNNQTRVYSIDVAEDWVDVVINREIEDFIVLEYVDFDSNSGLALERRSKRLLFDNNVVDGTWNRSRILSEADIERAVGCFNGWRYASCERSEGKDKPIVRYSKKYRVDRKAKNMFNAIRREYVGFKGTEDKKFLTDFANYVLEYLEYYYPEIEWIGEE